MKKFLSMLMAVLISVSMFMPQIAMAAAEPNEYGQITVTDAQSLAEALEYLNAFDRNLDYSYLPYICFSDNIEWNEGTDVVFPAFFRIDLGGYNLNINSGNLICNGYLNLPKNSVICLSSSSNLTVGYDGVFFITKEGRTSAQDAISGFDISTLDQMADDDYFWQFGHNTIAHNFKELKELLELYKSGAINSLSTSMDEIIVNEDYTFDCSNGCLLDRLTVNEGCTLRIKGSGLRIVNGLNVKGSIVLDDGHLFLGMGGDSPSTFSDSSNLIGINNITGKGTVEFSNADVNFSNNVIVDEDIRFEAETASLTFDGDLKLIGKIDTGIPHYYTAPKVGSVEINGGFFSEMKGAILVNIPADASIDYTTEWKKYITGNISDAVIIDYLTYPTYNSVVLGSANGKTILAKPTNLRWVTDTNSYNNKVSVNAVWDVNRPTQNASRMNIYNVNSSNFVGSWSRNASIGEYKSDSYHDVFGSESTKKDHDGKYTLTDGDYYFTIQSIGDGTNYISSEIASSKNEPNGIFHYVRPSAQIESPKVEFKDGMLLVTLPEDDNIAYVHYMCSSYKNATGSEADTQRSSGSSYSISENQFKEIFSDSNKYGKGVFAIDPNDFWFLNDYTGYFEATVYIASKDVTKVQYSEEVKSSNRLKIDTIKDNQKQIESGLEEIKKNLSEEDKKDVNKVVDAQCHLVNNCNIYI